MTSALSIDDLRQSAAVPLLVCSPQELRFGGELEDPVAASLEWATSLQLAAIGQRQVESAPTPELSERPPRHRWGS